MPHLEPRKIAEALLKQKDMRDFIWLGESSTQPGLINFALVRTRGEAGIVFIEIDQRSETGHLEMKVYNSATITPEATASYSFENLKGVCKFTSLKSASYNFGKKYQLGATVTNADRVLGKQTAHEATYDDLMKASAADIMAVQYLVNAYMEKALKKEPLSKLSAKLKEAADYTLLLAPQEFNASPWQVYEPKTPALGK